jgi:REP element-mobilizing transposase RayT
MKGPPVTLDIRQAGALITQYHETVRVRGWKFEAASVMYNHTHLVVGVPDDPDPEVMLELFKRWATRALKKLGPVPPNGAWWAVNGSKRKLKQVGAAVVYVVRKQPHPLTVWYTPEWQPVLNAWDRSEASRPA